MKGLFYKFPSNIVQCFRGRNILWHLLAIALTFFIVITDFDWHYFSHTRNPIILEGLFPAVILGGLLPIFLPLAILIVGAIRRNFKIRNLAFALGQAAILGSAISSFFKSITGRAHPTEIFLGSSADITKVFHFGFWRGGIFWGWPSTHTTIAFAMALSLSMLYPEKKIVKYLAIAYALYIGIGVSLTIHWFSDFVAGAIIGSVIGITVGQSFRDRGLVNKGA